MKLRVLLVSGKSATSKHVSKALGKAKRDKLRLEIVNSLKSAIDILNGRVFDIILLDPDLPDSKGLATLKRINPKALSSTVFVITDKCGFSLSKRIIGEGAKDCITKNDLACMFLPRCLNLAVWHDQHGAQLKALRKELGKLDQLKSDFISIVSHELRTPLSITKEGVSLVLDNITGELNEKQRKLLSTAYGNIDRLAKIIDSLLEISKLESGNLILKRGRISLSVVVKDALSFFEPRITDSGISLKVKYPANDEDSATYIDADKVRQVMVHILDNAIRFTEKGAIEVCVYDGKDSIKCRVKDTGIGISKKYLPKIFGKFQQFERSIGPGERGTGLGLSIAKGIIDLHKGNISIDSSLGKGTTITFSLPRHTIDTLLKECVDNGIGQAKKTNTKLSLLMVSIKGGQNVEKLMADIENIARGALLRRDEMALKGGREVYIVLPKCSKENGFMIMKHLEEMLADYITRKGLADSVKLKFSIAVYPDDVDSGSKLIGKIKEGR